MPESFWQGAGDSEPEFPVQLHSWSVGAHNIVELHGQETITPGLGKTALNKCAPNAFTLSGRVNYIGGASNVSSQAGVLGTELVHAKQVRKRTRLKPSN